MSYEKIKFLNYDHHKRMEQDHKGFVDNGGINKIIELDLKSWDKLISSLPAKENSKVLELGASTGHKTPYFKSKLKADEVKGIDIYEPDVLIAVERGFDIVVGSIEELPYADNSFDFVLSRHVLEHTYDIDKSLKEVYRVLKTGGYTASATPNYRPDPEIAHIYQPTVEELLHAYERNGFKVLDSYQDTFNCLELHIIAVK